MSNWLQLGHDSQRTSTDLDGNITSIVEVWRRKAAGDSRNGWAGAAIADSSSVYYAYSTYYPTIGGTGDRFSMIKYNRDGGIMWSNNHLGNHNTRNVWPAVAGDYFYYHDYLFQRLNVFTGGNEGGYQGGDSYGNIVFNSGETKMFSSRVAANEGYQGFIWVKAFDITTTPDFLFYNQLWVKNAADSGDSVGDKGSLAGAIVYDNSKVFYAPDYAIYATAGGWSFSSGIYCWNEAGVQQWYVAETPFGYMSAGDGRLYLAQGVVFTPNSVLKARSQTDGSVIWSKTISGIYATGQPPVVVGSLVIVASTTGIHAFDSATGNIAWTAAILNVLPVDGNKNREYTMLAAAGTSNTLVVTATNGIYILDLTDGSTVSSYDPPSLEGRPINPIIVGNRLYVTDLIDNNDFIYFPQAVLCLENGVTPPPSDVIPPSAPGNPSFSSVTTSSMTVSWVASTDNIAVAYYNLFYRQASGNWSSIVKTSLSHSFTGLSQSTTYEFYVNAVDAAGNVSTNSGTTTQATATPAVDSTIPSTPGTPTFTNVASTSMTVSWTGSTDNVAVSYYLLYWRPSGGQWTPITKTSLSHNFTGLISGITYEFYVAAVDTSGNRSLDSATTLQTTVVIVVDTTPPTTPGNPTFSAVTTTGMTVSWTASVDASGVASYTLFYREANGTWLSVTTSATSRSFTGLTPSTTYEFYVNSADIYGNQSTNSATTSQATIALPATFTQISGTTSITAASGQRTTHNLNWQNITGTMALQRRTGKTSFVTIYTGDAPYSYIQSDLKNVYYYRILVNGTDASNVITLKSARK